MWTWLPWPPSARRWCCPISSNGPTARLGCRVALYRASSQFHLTRVATVQACSGFDYVISPTAPLPAFAAELPSPTNDPLRPLEHIAFTVPFNMSEQPAASINCGYTAAGLPIGLQIAGKRFDDLGVLQVARAFELVRDIQNPWPLPPAQ